MKRSWGVAAVVVAALVGVACGAGGASDGTRTGSAGEAVQTQDPAGIGDLVRDGNFEFKVTKMTCDLDSVGSKYAKATASGDFCVVDVQVTNKGNEPQLFLAEQNFGFIGKKKYTADSSDSLYAVGAGKWTDDINPDTTAKFKLVFDVPSDKELTAIELHDSPFSGGVQVKP